MNWQLLWKNISDNPSPLLGGMATIVAALIGLVGLRWGLSHHRKRERKAREDEMLQKVYFDFVEAVARVFEAMSLIVVPSISDERLQELMRDYGPAFGRLHLVSNMRIVEAALNFNQQLQKTTGPLYGLRQIILQQKSVVEAVSKQTEEAAEILNKKMQTVGGAVSAETQAAINHLTELANRGMEDRKRVAMLMIDAGAQTQDAILSLVEADNELLLACRKNLGFAIDEEKYKTAMNKSSSEMAAFRKEQILQAKARIALDDDSPKA